MKKSLKTLLAIVPGACIMRVQVHVHRLVCLLLHFSSFFIRSTLIRLLLPFVPPIKMSNCKFMLAAEWIKFLMELLQLIDVYLCLDGRFIGCIRFEGLDVTVFRYRDIGGSVRIKISDIRCCGWLIVFEVWGKWFKADYLWRRKRFLWTSFH